MCVCHAAYTRGTVCEETVGEYAVLYVYCIICNVGHDYCIIYCNICTTQQQQQL